MPKGFLTLDLRYLEPLLTVLDGDVEAVRVYVWLLALAPSGRYEGSMMLLAKRAGLKGPRDLDVVLDRMVTMRVGRQVIISRENSPKGKPVIVIQRLSPMLILRGVPEGKTTRPVAQDEAPAAPAPVVKVKPADALARDRIETTKANLREREPDLAERMDDLMVALAARPDTPQLNLRAELAMWSAALQILGRDGRMPLSEAIRATLAKTADEKAPLTDSPLAYFQGVARRAVDDLNRRRVSGRLGVPRPAAADAPETKASPGASAEEDLF